MTRADTKPHEILPGQRYDLRSAGEVERDLPPFLVEAVEVYQLGGENWVECRSVRTGSQRPYPARLFTPERLR